jgi:hypothetical protein
MEVLTIKNMDLSRKMEVLPSKTMDFSVAKMTIYPTI